MVKKIGDGVTLKEQISRAVYSTVYESCRNTRCDIYYDPDTHDVRAVSSGASYPGIRVLGNVGASDFLVYDDPATYTEEEFVEACLAAHGYVEIPEA